MRKIPLIAQLDQEAVRRIVAGALAEDIGWGDVTTTALIGPGQIARGRLVTRQRGVLAGINVATMAFTMLDPGLKVETPARDGDRISPGDALAAIEGPARGMLSAERVALNFLQRLSGIATATAQYVEAVSGTKARIVDTRKTTPGLRVLEKYAVLVGGGRNHRFGLSDGILVKDNHLAVLRARGLGLRDAVAMAREGGPHTIRVEVEVETLDEVGQALEAGADTILLDNMDLPTTREAVRRVGGRAVVEASGGINLDTVRAVAECGVDFISVGALTHSARALDLGLDLEV